MNVITHELKLDLANCSTYRAQYKAKQFDSASVELKLTLLYAGVQIEITAGDSVVINAERPDGEKNGFFGQRNNDGTVTVPFAAWMLLVPGLVRCSISIINSAQEQKFTTEAFRIDVERLEYTGEAIEDDERYDVLMELIETVSSTVISGARISSGNLVLVKADGTEITVGRVVPECDSELSSTSEAPVQNKVIKEGIDTALQAAKEYTDEEIANFDFIKIVQTLPQSGLPNRTYFVPKTESGTSDLYDEYMWVNNAWEFIGTKTIEINLATTESAGIMKFPAAGWGIGRTAQAAPVVSVAGENAITGEATRGHSAEWGPITPETVKFIPSVLKKYGMLVRPFFETLTAAPTLATAGIPGKMYRHYYTTSDPEVGDIHHFDMYLCCCKYADHDTTCYAWAKIAEAIEEGGEVEIIE